MSDTYWRNAEALLRELAESDPIGGTEYSECALCRNIGDNQCKTCPPRSYSSVYSHSDDCVWLKARKFFEMDPEPCTNPKHNEFLMLTPQPGHIVQPVMGRRRDGNYDDRTVILPTAHHSMMLWIDWRGITIPILKEHLTIAGHHTTGEPLWTWNVDR